MRVLLTGAGGQLGQALIAACPAGVTLIPTSRSGGAGASALDLADADACRRLVLELRPDAVLNAGAYTAVDRAEQEAELAQAVNGAAPGALAAALADHGGRLLQVSTDFIFDGTQGHPYRPEQQPAPLGVYGASKAEGERRARAVLGDDLCCVLRTSWVHGPVGRNFVLTMLRLHRERGEQGEPIAVVADQVGTPTATHSLAEACWAAIRSGLGGVHHWCDAGVASWYDLAIAVGELAEHSQLLRRAAPVRPILTADYPTPARRPFYSLLDCSGSRAALGLDAVHWRSRLAEVLAELRGP